MKTLEGKTAFITGGASGIGLGIARACLANGMQVVIADIGEERLAQAAGSLGQPDQLKSVVVDVRDRKQLEDAADAVEKWFSKIHVVCNNAGIGHGGSVVSVNSDLWSRTMDTNLMGTLHGVQVFVPRIRSHGEGGHIVNTASITGFAQQGSGVPYGVSKAGIIALTEVLRPELAGPAGRDRWRHMYCAGSERWDDGEPEGSISASLLMPDAVDTPISAFYSDPNDSEEVREKKKDWLRQMDIELVRPEKAGEYVISGILNDEPYIFCDGYGSRRLVSNRTQALLSALDRQFPDGESKV